MPAIERQEEFDSMPTRPAGLRSVESGAQFDRSADSLLLVRATRAELLAQRQALVLSIVAELLGPATLEGALDAFVAALQQRFSATRVALALANDQGVLELGAISQQALIEMASNEVRLLLDVMEECLEFEKVVLFPDDDVGTAVLTAHQALGSRRTHIHIVTVPLYRDGQPVGALMLERHDARPMIPASLELLQHIAIVSAPALSLRRHADRSAFARARYSLTGSMKERFGAGRFGTRSVLVLIIGILLLATLVPFSRTVSTHAELVPRERQLVTAPFDGFVETVAVEPGQSVSAGQLLARLEQRELELEGTRRDGEIATAEAEFRAAMASHDRQATAVARARLERERALRALVDQRLERIELRAPIAGLIANGDPGDIVGAPVTRGQTLFEIARADGYDVHLLVHERDIRDVSEAQRGTLSLRARPGDDLELIVRSIHPVAESIDGASRFRVRASLDVPPGITPRPGESGVAELHAGKTNLVSLWGRPVRQHLTELWWRFSR